MTKSRIAPTPKPIVLASTHQGQKRLSNFEFVTLHDFILHHALQIRKRRSKHGDPLFETPPVGGHAPSQMMADAVGRRQFIHNGEIAAVERLVKDIPDDGFALNA